MNNKLERIIKKYLGSIEDNQANLIYISNNKNVKIKNVKHYTVNNATTSINDINTETIVIIEHDNLNDITKIIDKYQKQVNIFILIVPKKFDFDNFMKTANVTFADVYNIKGEDYYYIGTN